MNTVPWVPVTVAAVQRCVFAQLLTQAAKRAQGQGGAGLTIEGLFAQAAPGVVARVRNKVASHLGNQISADVSKVPPELVDQTALLIADQMMLPLSQFGLPLSEDQRRLITTANRDLDAAARGDFAVSLPDDPLASPPVARGGEIQIVNAPPRRVTRESVNGL